MTVQGDVAWHVLDPSEPNRLRALNLDTPRITLDAGGSIREQHQTYWGVELGVDRAARG